MSFTQDENGIVSVKGHETHAITANGVHEIFKDTKPLRNFDVVVDLLLQYRLIKNGC